MKKIISIIALVLTSCYQFDPCQTQYQIDPKAQPFLDEFYALAESHGRHFDHNNLIISIVPGLQAQGALGETIFKTNSTGQRLIELDQDYWNASSDSKRLHLFLHECGHCFLGRNHTTTLSIMNIKYFDFGNDKDYLIDELFKPQ